MPEPLPDRWASRDLPFLIEAARILDEGEDDFRATRVQVPGLDEQAKVAAARALIPGYLSGHPLETASGIIDMFIHDLTERGRRTVGLWPSGEGVDALIDALRQAEDATTDPEEKSLIRRAAGAVTSVSRDVMVDVVAAVINRQIGGQ